LGVGLLDLLFVDFLKVVVALVLLRHAAGLAEDALTLAIESHDTHLLAAFQTAGFVGLFLGDAFCVRQVPCSLALS
jgi:hypothetical protein